MNEAAPVEDVVGEQEQLNDDELSQHISQLEQELSVFAEGKKINTQHRIAHLVTLVH